MAFTLPTRFVRIAAAVALSFTMLAVHGPAEAKIRKVSAKVDISEQRMKVYVNGVHKKTFKVSTGARGYITPTGSWKPTRMHKMWYSRKYDMAPMPHSVFFYRGYAVHATNAIKRLGRPASHGCIRLHPKNARQFFNLVLAAGRANTSITIQK